MKKKTSIVALTVLSLIAIACLLPFIMVLSASFTDNIALKINGYGIFPSKFSTTAYQILLENPKPIINAYGVTIFNATVGTILGIIMQCGVAYAISREDYKYRDKVSLYLYITMLFNGGLIPTYMLIANYLNMKDTIWVLIIPMLCSTYHIYLLRSFFSTIPRSLVEAAKIEGASELTILFKIAIPLAKTGIATVSLFTVLAYWNDWYYSMMYMSSDKIISLQYLLMRMLNNAVFLQLKGGMSGGLLSTMKLPEETIRMATCIVTTGPMIILFPFFQKYFISGITAGAVKE